MAAERPLLLGQWLRLVAFHGAGAAIAAATVALAAMGVPPAVYGDYGVMLSLVHSASSIGFGWINAGIVRIGREEFMGTGSMAGTLRAGLALAAFVAMAIVLVSVTVAAVLPRWPSPAERAMMAAAFLALVAFQFFATAAHAHGRFEGFAGGQIIARLGPLAAAGVFLVLSDQGPLVLLAGATIGYLLAAHHCARPILARPLRSDRAWRTRATEIVRYARWLPVSSVAVMALQWMGFWLVHRGVGAAEAGILLWAMGALALVGGALQPLGASLAPRLIDLRLADDRAGLGHRLDLLIAIGVLLASLAPFLVGCVLLAGALLLPAAYAPAAGPLAALFASLPALALSSVAVPLVSAFERMIGRLVAVIVAGAAVQLAVLLVLVPGFGAEGAAYATALTTALMAAAHCALARIARGGMESLRTVLSRALAVGAVPIACAVLLRQVGPWQTAALGPILTLALLLACRRGGLLRLLGDFAPQLWALPAWPRRLAIAALAWLAR